MLMETKWLFLKSICLLSLVSLTQATATREGNVPRDSEQARTSDDDEPDLSQIADGEPAYTGDNNSDEEPADAYYEPFDPEKNGFLLHEYFDEAYKKYPDYDTTTMKLNLNYYGDVLLSDKNKDVTVNEEADISKFSLDPEEKELFLNENDDEKKDIQEAKNEDDDNDPDNDDNTTTDDDKVSDSKQTDTEQLEDWFENDN